MITVLQVLGLWVVLSAVAAAGVCLVLTGARLNERCSGVRDAVPVPAPLALEEERAVSA